MALVVVLKSTLQQRIRFLLVDDIHSFIEISFPQVFIERSTCARTQARCTGRATTLYFDV